MNPNGNTNKTFLKNISILLVVNLIIKPIYIFGIDAQTQNMLGENQYGLYFGLFNFCMLFQIILDPGILNYNSQLISKNANKVESYFSEILGAKVLLIGLYVVSVMLFAMGSSYPRDYYQYLPGILTILILTSLANYFRSHFSALGRYSYESWFSGLDKLLMILILGYFLFIKKEISIHFFIMGQVLALTISCYNPIADDPIHPSWWSDVRANGAG